jgi:hypothetical protein
MKIITRREIDVDSGRVWAGRQCLSDSTQVRDLRERLEDDAHHRFSDQRKSPLRLGIYAGECGIRITDFGRHSKRWIRLFEQGVEAGRNG